MNRVVVIEDHPWYAQQQQRLLEAEGYRVAHATNPQDGMELIEQFKPKVLILDMLLKNNTAMVLLNELQSHEETARLPVVLYTAQASALSQDVLAHYGVVALLDKTTMEPRDIVKSLKRIGL